MSFNKQKNGIKRMRWLTLYGTFESVIKDQEKLVNRLNKAEITKDARTISSSNMRKELKYE